MPINELFFICLKRCSRAFPIAVLAMLGLLNTTTAGAQGRAGYYNVESPQVHPIELITLNDRSTEADFLLVVNTPDNSLEIYGANSNQTIATQFRQRIRTGLEPVSVRWVSELGRFYVANFLGDSLTSGRLEWSSSGDELRVYELQTVEVIDEPLDVTHVPGTAAHPHGTLVVTHMTLDTLSLLDPITLAFAPGGYESGTEPCHLEVDPQCPTEGPNHRRFVPSATNDVDGDNIPDDINGLPGADDVLIDSNVDTFALKQPWTAAMSPACDRLFVLGHLGGSSTNTPSGFRYDVDLWSQNASRLRQGPADTEAVPRIRGGLGTANWNMAFDDEGLLYVVASNALQQVNGEEAVASQPTGFVESMLYVVEDACTHHPSTTSRDLNARFTPGEVPAHRLQAVAQPTDLVVRRNATGATQVLFTSFGTDLIGQVTLVGDPESWPVATQFVIPPSGSSSPIAGPRGLAIQEGASPRLFVLNRLSNSINVLEPDSLNHLEPAFALQHDPTPDWILKGRRFLYDARLSGNDFDSCASCHLDGRTDGLAWDLSGPLPGLRGLDCNGNSVLDPQEIGDCDCLEEPDEDRAEVDVTLGESCLSGIDCNGDGFIQVSELADCDCDGVIDFDADDGVACVPEQLSALSFTSVSTQFLPDKRFMVTQSLQGLLNHELPPEGSQTTGETPSQRFATNAPYHWRGDRSTFRDFNGAFVGLLGAERVLTDEEMALFEEFINSIHYPPNPKQTKDRRYTGSFGDPTMDDGTGALRGLKFFHTLNTATSVSPSCVHCHALPEGSDNTLTLAAAPTRTEPFNVPSGTVADAPLETAALRGLFQKEARREVNADTPVGTGPITGYEGLGHSGVHLDTSFAPNKLDTLNAFHDHFFFRPDNDRKHFLQEFDFGTAPIVGRSLTVTKALANSTADPWTSSWGMAWLLAEAQADLANAGLAVQASFSGVDWGLFYDPASDLAANGEPVRYRLETPFGPSPAFSRTGLLQILASAGDGDWVTLISTPLGSERRVASPTGQPVPQSLFPGLPPSDLSFLPMVPSSALECVPLLETGWLIDTPLQPTMSHTIQVYQAALLLEDSFGRDSFGVESARHVVPRRFRVSGRDLTHGATLHLLVPDAPVSSPPEATPPPPGMPPKPPSKGYPMTHLEIPLHPTLDRHQDGAPIWESSVEIDPLLVYRMMAGPPNWEVIAETVPKHIMQGLTDLDFRDRTTDDFHVDISTAPSPHVVAGVFQPDSWNQHYAWIVNGDDQRVDLGWVQARIDFDETALLAACP